MSHRKTDTVEDDTAQDPRSRALRERALAALACVHDPEIPVLTIADLGILRDVRIEGEKVEAVITPTYSGCPAMNMIAVEADLALEKAGFTDRKITTVLSPAWTTDWMSDEGRAKLLSYGIVPPAHSSSRASLFGKEAMLCPRCGSPEVERISEFGSTACKALWRCKACREPFDHFKCI
ncbi:MAG: phenylacetate-CoA oxygenase subunit PaaJ [Hyphomicrobiales bacterium]|nr:phenylacetate-CoA oxygenase subunit PaaJ [Hyphomicrobiales bacterium]MBV9520542.1 phenylacetate-CoA oxygenase subunit PaaJ [Hyphomicrobiales bacterium]